MENKNTEKYIIVLASKDYIAKDIFRRYFFGKTHTTNRHFLGVLSHIDKLIAYRNNVTIVISSERYLPGWAYDLKERIQEYAPVYGWEIVYESDLEANS